MTTEAPFTIPMIKESKDALLNEEWPPLPIDHIFSPKHIEIYHQGESIKVTT